MAVTLTNEGIKLLLDRGVNLDADANYTPISQLWIGSDQTTPSITDSDLVRPVPIQYSTVETVDDCETADWTEGTDSEAETLNSSSQKEGSNSLNLGKDGTSGTTFSYSKTTTSVDFTDKTLFVWVYIETIADLVASGTAVSLRFGSDNSNYYQYDVDVSDLSAGWNLLYFTSSDASSTQGSPTITACDYSEIIFNVDNSADTVTLGDCRMDYWHVVSSDDYPEPFASGYPTVPDNNLNVELRAEILDTEANGYVINGFAWKNTDGTPKLCAIANTVAVTKDSAEQLIYFSKIKARHV